MKKLENKEKINIWNFPMKGFYLLLNEKFKKELFLKFFPKFKDKKTAVKILNKSSRKYGLRSKFGTSNLIDWEKGRNFNGKRKIMWMPLWICIEICKISNIGLDKLQNNVVSYKYKEQGNPINNPKLPIIVSPEFDSVLMHLLGDGSFGSYGRCASYKQKNEFGRRNFYIKLKRVFGDFDLNENEYEKSWKILIPKSIIEIIRKKYSIEENARGLITRIPKNIMKKGKKHKLACLISFLVDEGHIGDSIEMYSSNKKLLSDIKTILDCLGYINSGVILKCKKGYRKHNYDHYRLRMSINSAKKLLKDIWRLKKDYQTCYLAHKQKNLEEIVGRQKLNKRKSQDGLVKNKIINILKSKPTTTKKLRTELLLCGATIREHLEYLEKREKIIRLDKNKNSIIWSLKSQLGDSAA